MLNKLKNLGDRSDLEYLLKTQKIDYTKFKVTEKTVEVEDYIPELNREAKDLEYQE